MKVKFKRLNKFLFYSFWLSNIIILLTLITFGNLLFRSPFYVSLRVISRPNTALSPFRYVALQSHKSQHHFNALNSFGPTLHLALFPWLFSSFVNQYLLRRSFGAWNVHKHVCENITKMFPTFQRTPSSSNVRSRRFWSCMIFFWSKIPLDRSSFFYFTLWVCAAMMEKVN